MPEIIFSKKEFQMLDFELFIFLSKFNFLGTALGQFSQYFLKIFCRRPTMVVADIFTQPHPLAPPPHRTIKKLPTALPRHLLYNTQARNFMKKETLAQVFSCEFCKISKNTFFTEHLRTTASEYFTLPKQLASKTIKN